jgi:ABC-type nitrate/sulfonate/bicarbonate transport system substrate-binding protein
VKTRRSSLLHNSLRLAAAVLVLAACTPAATTAPTAAPTSPPATAVPTAVPEPQKITFQAAYIAQGNISFVPVYVAAEKGYFAEQGLDVTIEHSSPGSGEQLQRLAAKDIEFTTHTGDNFAKAHHDTPDLPFVAVAVLGHETDHSLLVLADSGIDEIGDLAGLKVGFKSGEAIEPPWMLAMLTEAGLDLNDVELINVGFDPRVVLPEYGEGRVDAVQVFRSNEPDTLGRMGYETKLFSPEDYGIHFLGQLFITHRDFIRDDPEMVRKFLKATMRAMQFIQDPANASEVTDIVMKYAGADADREHNQFIWQTELEFVTAPSTEGVGIGYADDSEWTNMMNVMVEFGSIDSAVPVDQLWDPQFVQSIYQNGSLVWP